MVARMPARRNGRRADNVHLSRVAGEVYAASNLLVSAAAAGGYAFTMVQPPSFSGRNACSAGVSDNWR
jgi:hypothetical protein